MNQFDSPLADLLQPLIDILQQTPYGDPGNLSSHATKVRKAVEFLESLCKVEVHCTRDIAEDLGDSTEPVLPEELLIEVNDGWRETGRQACIILPLRPEGQPELVYEGDCLEAFDARSIAIVLLNGALELERLDAEHRRDREAGVKLFACSCVDCDERQKATTLPEGWGHWGKTLEDPLDAICPKCVAVMEAEGGVEMTNLDRLAMRVQTDIDCNQETISLYELRGLLRPCIEDHGFLTEVSRRWTKDHDQKRSEAAHQERRANWSHRTFREASPLTCLLHLREEVEEAITSFHAMDPNHAASVRKFREELADCRMLLDDAVERAGVSVADHLEDREAKLSVCEARTWVPTPEGYNKHVEAPQ